MLNIALAGFGHHGRHAVLPALQTCPDAQPVALCDPREDAFQGVATEGLDLYDSFEALLDAGGFDAVYIATMEDLHLPMVTQALRAGFHVLCEKPLATSAEDCRAMLDAAAQADRRLAVGFEKRYHRDQQKVHEWITSGLLGHVEGIHFQEFWDGHKTFGALAARRANHVDQSGCLDCGVHCLDLGRFFGGNGDWTNIHAVGRWFGEDERIHPVHASVIGELSTGPVVTLNSSYAYCANIKPRPRSFALTVVGTEGVVNWAWDGEQMLELTLTCRDRTETFAWEKMPHAEAIRYMLSDFARAVEDPGNWPVHLARGEDGLAAQVILEESLRQTAAQHP